MKTVHYERGRFIEAPAEVIACLWSNWEIYDALLGTRFHLERVGENEWAGHYFLKGSGKLVSRDASLDSGRFVYTVQTTIAGLPASTAVTLRYLSSDPRFTSVHGEFENELSVVPSAIEPFTRGIIHKVLDQFIEGGQTSCELISKQYERIRKELPEEYMQTIDAYLEAGRRLRQGPFETSLLSPSSRHIRVSSVAPLTSEFDDLVARVGQLQAQIGDVADDLQKAIAISNIDLASGLATNRRTLERIVRSLYEAEVGVSPGGRSLGPLLQDLKKQSDGIPTVIFAHMNTVLELGNIGTHDDPRENLRQLRHQDFEVSFSALLFVVEWYFNDYHGRL